MSKRKYFLLSLILACGAIALHILALGDFNESITTIARSIQKSGRERIPMKASAHDHRVRGETLEQVGLALALTSIVLAVVSSRHREPDRLSIIQLLLIFYFLLIILIV